MNKMYKPKDVLNEHLTPLNEKELLSVNGGFLFPFLFGIGIGTFLAIKLLEKEKNQE